MQFSKMAKEISQDLSAYFTAIPNSVMVGGRGNLQMTIG